MNVYDLSNERLSRVFSDFDNISVSFSGGKDSGVMLNLVIDYIRKNNIRRKISVFHIDYEAQYQMTTDYVDAVLSENLDIIEVYRICLPLVAHCATSMYQSYWQPWEKSKQDIWVRKMPENGINEDNHNFDFYKSGMTDYEFQEKFSLWLHNKNKAKRTISLVGIRTQESLNRWRAIHAERNYRNYDSLKWTKELYANVFNGYPIYDWQTSDIWVANAKFNWSYNKLYDIFYQAGLSIDMMRVASPFNDWATSSLKLYRVIDPNNWAKMVGRVNGVNFTGIYGGTTAMGWKSIKLPNGHTWKSYMEYLLNTLPKETADNYRKKLEASKKSWLVGGAMDYETIKQLEAENAPLIRTGKTNNRGNKDKEVIQFNDYLDDTNVDDFRRIPTYKRMCICIMKNDHLCKYMGFAPTANEIQKREKIMEKYKSML